MNQDSCTDPHRLHVSSAQPNHVPVAEDIPSEHTALTGEETGEDRDEPFGDAADVWS